MKRAQMRWTLVSEARERYGTVRRLMPEGKSSESRSTRAWYMVDAKTMENAAQISGVHLRLR